MFTSDNGFDMVWVKLPCKSTVIVGRSVVTCC